MTGLPIATRAGAAGRRPAWPLGAVRRVLQLQHHVPGALPPVVGVFCEAARDDVIEAGRGERLERREGRRRRVQDRGDHAACVAPRMGAGPSPSRRSRRRARRCRSGVRRSALELLGGHVLERADDRRRPRDRVRLGGGEAIASMRRLFARPKSSSFAPDRVSITLPGFRSRWTMPARCARSSASATSTACAAPGPRQRPDWRRAASVSPSTNSITR